VIPGYGQPTYDPLEDLTEETTVSSWAPVDLSAFIDGTFLPPQPGLLFRLDGVGLLYPGRVHSFHGESESGKSWVALISSVEVLNNGGTVLYVDFESTPDEIVARLLRLGVDAESLCARFYYVQPECSSDLDPQSFSDLLGRQYDLAVIDGVTESLGLYKAPSVDNDAVTTWGRKLPRRIARETGAAVVCIDHVTKSAESRGRFAIGGQAKLALLDGAAYVVEPKDLAPGQVGWIILRVAKDRAGQVRQNSGTRRASDQTQEAARIRVDSTSPSKMVYTVEPFGSFVNPDTGESTFRPTHLMERVSRHVEAYPGQSKTAIETAVLGKAEAKRRALDLLVAEGYIVATDYIARGKPGKRYSSLLSYREHPE
jgi:hypothetical protein